jgi:hypothetical protein
MVFHRGRLFPYNTYSAPFQPYPYGVTVTNDGTVVASNAFSNFGPQGGSISTWIKGPNGGTFVGTFPMVNSQPRWVYRRRQERHPVLRRW